MAWDGQPLWQGEARIAEPRGRPVVVQRWEIILDGEPIRNMLGGTLGTGLFNKEGRKKDSGAHLKYLKNPPMDKQINLSGTSPGKTRQAAHTNGEECSF